MKCGVGICGSCCVGEDLVCRDGTVFDGKHLSQKQGIWLFSQKQGWNLGKLLNLTSKV